jgi:hypothetical protein
MQGKIYLIDSGQQLQAMKETPYEAEKVLQTLLAKYPDLLAGEQVDGDNPRRWLLVKGEMEVSDEEDGSDRWSLDHLFLDQDGIPTLVEVKRSTDTRIRRHVVGQMLDYAANAIHWSIDRIKKEFETGCQQRRQDADRVLLEFLDKTTSPNESEEDSSEEADGAGEDELNSDPASVFWQKVKTNLLAGKIRIVFVADEIPRELLTVITFLNEQMDPAEVLALEVKQYVDDRQTIKTLVPRIVGIPREGGGRGHSHTRWSGERLVKRMVDSGKPAAAKVVQDLLNWARQFESDGLRIGFRDAKNNPNARIFVRANNQRIKVLVMYAERRVKLRLDILAERTCFRDPSKLSELMEQLNRVPGFSLIMGDMKDNRPIEYEQLASLEQMEAFKGALKWIAKTIQEHPLARES